MTTRAPRLPFCFREPRYDGVAGKVTSMASIDFAYTVLERFLRYVTIDTQSNPDSTTTP